LTTQARGLLLDGAAGVASASYVVRKGEIIAAPTPVAPIVRARATNWRRESE
jgi:hypothetical protein